MPTWTFDPAEFRRGTPESVTINRRIARATATAVGAPLSEATPAQAMDVLRAHLYGLVIANIAVSPDDDAQWMARLEAVLLAAVDLARDLRIDGGAAFLNSLVREKTPS